MESLSFIIGLISIFLILYLLYTNWKNSKVIEKLSEDNKRFLESIEKYVEIFNEQNVKDLLLNKDLTNEEMATDTLNLIKSEFRKKLISIKGKLTEEHEILIDFLELSFALLIKTPPSLRKKLIDENTTNDEIKKILNSKLHIIEKHYVPVSILEVAISKSNV
jgi:hypothetical protein